MTESLHLDLTGAKLSFEALPIGAYDAHVVEVKHGPSAATGEPNLAWTFEVDEEPYEGRKLFLNTSLQSQAIWKLGQTLMAFGWSEEEITAKGGFDLEVADLVDLPCRLVVSQQMYQGQMRNRVQRVLPPTGGVEPSSFEGEEAEAEAFELPF